MTDYIALADSLRAAFDREDIDWDNLLAAERALRDFAARIAQAAPEDRPRNRAADPSEFEPWLRTVCFQKPTPEAYDLAKCAWKTALSIAPMEQDREDAARLDWLGANPRLAEIIINGATLDCYVYAVSGAPGVTLREIIDAARQAPKEPTK